MEIIEVWVLAVCPTCGESMTCARCRRIGLSDHDPGRCDVCGWRDGEHEPKCPEGEDDSKNENQNEGART